MVALKWFGLAALMLACFLCIGVCTAETAQDITAACKIKTSEGKASRFLDARISSSWGYKQPNATVTIELPENETPGALLVKWKFEPSGYTIEEFDANREPLALRDQDSAFPCINSYYPLNEHTRYITLTMTDTNQRISTLRLYASGETPDDVQQWDPPVEKADLMVVSAHQDDELIFFGGLIPYYNLVEGRSTQVVYMADCARSRREEALNSLWAMGVRTYPEFINLLDEHIRSYDQTLYDWGGADYVVMHLVRRIRRYQPEVIVTHDLNGEYGHNQHKITARLMQTAIESAADSSYDPDSAQFYGTWQTKKLYLHLYSDNRVYLDWQTPYEQLGGLTPLESAQLGYSKHVSQHKYYQVVAGGQYDNAAFGLSYTTVGLDTAGTNDLFEHISQPPTEAVPSAAPATDAPTAEPALSQATQAPSASPLPSTEAPAPSARKRGAWKWVLLTLPVFIAAYARQRQVRRQRERERRRRQARRARMRAQGRALPPEHRAARPSSRPQSSRPSARRRRP